MSVRSQSDIPELADPMRWADEHGDKLLRFALARVGQREAAEDLVQEALLAAWRARDSFDGRSGFRTWLIAILRRKISDYYRRFGREPPLVTHTQQDIDTALFDDRGKWIAAPRKWSLPPDRIAEDSEFWRVLADCIIELPGHLAQAFELREIGLLPIDEICGVAGISAKNLSVRLHRARLLLRQCLEKHWFCPKDRRR
ncbi:MAG: sigma-70 family RNA polymerase sigma factor [Planctomycetes bacterium]|nr:sigma-70 family RNA polymerase sigma factor [Planctomycetota bacterium]